MAELTQASINSAVTKAFRSYQKRYEEYKILKITNNATLFTDEFNRAFTPVEFSEIAKLLEQDKQHFFFGNLDDDFDKFRDLIARFRLI